MKKYLPSVFSCILLLSLSYPVFSFIAWNFNISEWHPVLRLAYVLIGMIAFGNEIKRWKAI